MADDWRFKDFKDTGGAHSRTLAVPTSSFAAANFQNQYGNGATPTPTATPPRTNATSRIIPSPSNTNWNSTFNQNSPSSPTGTDWAKTFGQKPSFVSKPVPARDAAPRTSGGFQFDLAPANTRNQLSLGNDVSSFYKDRLADTDLSSRDHELYGAGNDYGFAF